MMVRRDAAGVRLLTRNGHDWTSRFPLIAEAAGALKVRSFLVDGEAVACDADGMPSFDRLRYRRQDGAMFLFAFDLLELNGQDRRREPLETRKATLASLLRKAGLGVQLNDHLEHEDGGLVIRHACKMGSPDCRSSAAGWIRRLCSPSCSRGPRWPFIGLHGAGSAEVLQLPVLVLAEDDGALWCPNASNKSAAVSSACRPKNPPGGHAARRAILWATCRTVGRATSASQARVSLIVVPDVVP